MNQENQYTIHLRKQSAIINPENRDPNISYYSMHNSFIKDSNTTARKKMSNSRINTSYKKNGKKTNNKISKSTAKKHRNTQPTFSFKNILTEHKNIDLSKVSGTSNPRYSMTAIKKNGFKLQDTTSDFGNLNKGDLEDCNENYNASERQGFRTQCNGTKFNQTFNCENRMNLNQLTYKSNHKSNILSSIEEKEPEKESKIIFHPNELYEPANSYLRNSQLQTNFSNGIYARTEGLSFNSTALRKRARNVEKQINQLIDEGNKMSKSYSTSNKNKKRCDYCNGNNKSSSSNINRSNSNINYNNESYYKNKRRNSVSSCGEEGKNSRNASENFGACNNLREYDQAFKLLNHFNSTRPLVSGLKNSIQNYNNAMKVEKLINCNIKESNISKESSIKLGNCLNELLIRLPLRKIFMNQISTSMNNAQNLHNKMRKNTFNQSFNTNKHTVRYRNKCASIYPPNDYGFIMSSKENNIFNSIQL